MRIDVSAYRQLVGVVALMIWITSLALPVETDCGYHPIKGYLVLETGWLGPLGGQFGWYANPFMLWTIGQNAVQQASREVSLRSWALVWLLAP